MFVILCLCVSLRASVLSWVKLLEQLAIWKNKPFVQVVLAVGSQQFATIVNPTNWAMLDWFISALPA